MRRQTGPFRNALFAYGGMRFWLELDTILQLNLLGLNSNAIYMTEFNQKCALCYLWFKKRTAPQLIGLSMLIQGFSKSLVCKTSQSLPREGFETVNADNWLNENDHNQTTNACIFRLLLPPDINLDPATLTCARQQPPFPVISSPSQIYSALPSAMHKLPPLSATTCS